MNHRITCAFCGERFVGNPAADVLTISVGPVKAEDYKVRSGNACKSCRTKADRLIQAPAHPVLSEVENG